MKKYGTEKWTISIDDQSLIVKIHQHPTHVIMRLGGLSEEILNNLADYFSSAATAFRPKPQGTFCVKTPCNCKYHK